MFYLKASYLAGKELTTFHLQSIILDTSHKRWVTILESPYSDGSKFDIPVNSLTEFSVNDTYILFILR